MFVIAGVTGRSVASPCWLQLQSVLFTLNGLYVEGDKHDRTSFLINVMVNKSCCFLVRVTPCNRCATHCVTFCFTLNSFSNLPKTVTSLQQPVKFGTHGGEVDSMLYDSPFC